MASKPKPLTDRLCTTTYHQLSEIAKQPAKAGSGPVDRVWLTGKGDSMSRVHLYQKVKAISGLTAAEPVRNYRLGQATRLLRDGRSVADTAEAVGFDSPGYFAKCFQERYGQSPTEFQHAPGVSPDK